jgi:hypothetical protein
VTAHSTEETRKATVKMLHTIIVLTQTMDPLPDNVMMTMKILYYDEGKFGCSLFELKHAKPSACR